ncbi:NAD(P)-binding protein [Martensiomyces pterosporus]|nr:NAD(P)-binding protein [Martensiomyces pterosporus]
MAEQQHPPVAVVTRIGSWIGTETAATFLKRGVTVIGIATHQSRIDRVQETLSGIAPEEGAVPGKFIPCAGSLLDKQVLDQIMEHLDYETTAGGGRLVALVNNAGAYEDSGEAAGTHFEQWDKLQHSLIEPLKLFHRIRHLMRRFRARAINVASDDTHAHLPRQISLVAIKTAVNMLTAELALLEPYVTSLAVHPNLPSTASARGESATGASAGGSQRQGPASNGSSAPDTEHLLPAGELIVDLALNADRSMSGKFFVYNEPDLSQLV